ncbi:MAG: ParB/RepB/Spo0J family partition protein [Phycisphaerales bacterium]|nr:ParB/RepB/Spo0J family partition protein [Phycisphaerales bacterium]MCB9856782.1 ParB/RepB/Spo0J family partition protein [Phycisphaerales bacterium]MCB9862091.1 ParB/RepB/Spo0J family partition protein [Phycisphaerales bacterium]
MSKTTNKRLGRGLSSLIRSDLNSPPEREAVPEKPVPAAPAAVSKSPQSVAPPSSAPVSELPIDQIRTNPSQPRRTFDPERLAALAESLKQRGALQPIVVRPIEGGYELVAGERRLRASKLAKLDRVPVIVRNVRDDDMLELALIENVQRENLNPVEKARAYRTLVQKHGLSQEEVAGRMGEDRSSVANYIRLLGLSERPLELLGNGELSVGHGKALLAVADAAKQTAIAERAVAEGWSVRRTEQVVTEAAQPKPEAEAKSAARGQRPAVREMQDRLTSILGTRVSLKEGRKRHSGKIVIEYYNLDDFEKITTRLGVEREAADI